ncbi:MAG: rod shape-determining protein MreC [Herbaspirillum sp.]|jgi:rod shape-determining protein MreC|nr:rod shape-determining protein MreC [Herbaspirillum sp.]
MSGLPPLFKQGASARARVLFFAFISIVLLVIDSHVHTLDSVRKVVGTALYPLQMLALVPRDTAIQVTGYFTALSTLEQENKALKLRQAQSAQMEQQQRLLFAENLQLRNLLGMQQKLTVKSVVGEILYDARDPFTRKVVLNRGSQQGVALGQPVIDDLGIVGQITRVFPFTSEVTLLTDKDQAIPVLVLRNGLRSIAYGRGQSGVLDLRYLSANADIQKGDMLVTSGIDGVYPSGLAVATVTQAETKSSDTFAHIVCTPVAGVDRHKQLLILLVDANMPPRPSEVAPIKYDKNAKVSIDVRDKSLEKPAEKAPAAGVAAAVKIDTKPVVARPTPDVNPAAKPAAAKPEAAHETKPEGKPAVPPKPAQPAATPSQPPKVVR